jgi:pyruvate,water dikinase
MEKLVIPFDQLSIKDVGKVGGKNASLGELHRYLRPLGIRIPDGFSVTAAGYSLFLQENNLEHRIAAELAALDTHHFTNLQQVSSRLKTVLLQARLPHRLEEEILDAYRQWQKRNLLGDGVEAVLLQKIYLGQVLQGSTILF